MNQSEKNNIRYCRNCHYPLSPTANFCSHCSQKFTTGRISIGQLFKDLINNLFNLDSKFFLTIGALFIPARLTIQYFKGRHKRFAGPLRVFLVTAVFCFAIVGVYINQQNLNIDQFGEEIKKFEKKAFVAKTDSLSQAIEEIYPDKSVSLALDSLRNLIRDSLLDKGDSNFQFSTIKFSSLFADSVEDIRLTPRELLLTEEELFEKYQITSVIDRVALRQVSKFYRTGDIGSYLKFLLGNMIWLMLLLIPNMAFVLKILYIRRPYYYVEHLVFLLHFHAFALLLTGVYYTIKSIVPTEGDLILIPIIHGYLFFALRRFYQQGWIKTFVKYCVFNIAYASLFIVFLALISVISFFLF